MAKYKLLLNKDCGILSTGRDATKAPQLHAMNHSDVLMPLMRRENSIRSVKSPLTSDFPYSMVYHEGSATVRSTELRLLRA